MQGIGGLFGWLLVISLIITLANYPVKLINRMVIKRLPDKSLFRKTVGRSARVISRYHRFFALAAQVLLITHFILQITYRYLSLTGLIAGGLMILQVPWAFTGITSGTKSDQHGSISTLR